MKKMIFLTAMCCLLAISAVAQSKKASDFSGNWALDVSKSKLGERARVESMTLNVVQTDKELKVESATKRATRPEGETSGGGQRGGGMGGRMGGGFGSDGTTVYSLDGKETIASGQNGGTAALKAEVSGDKLKLTTTRKINSPMGEATIVTKETWELLDGGKILKVMRDSETPRGTMSTEMIFTKK